MKKIFFPIASILTSLVYGQVIIGSKAETATSATEKPYAGLEVRSNQKQGFQIPTVYIKDVTSDTYPINKPKSGTLVYNIDSPVQQGVYIWNQKERNGRGLWMQLADTSNIVSSMFIKTTESFDILENKNLGEFVSLLEDNPTIATNGSQIGKYKVVANQIGAKLASKGITLKENSGYTVALALDIEVDPGLSTTRGIGGSDIYQHAYTIKLVDENGVTHANPVDVLVNSIAGKNSRSHSVYAYFSFPLVLDPITLFPHISYQRSDNGTNGGNFYKGRPAGNTGKVTIKSATIHIDRGILSL